MLARLQKVADNSVDSEKAYQKVLAIDPANEDALSGWRWCTATWRQSQGAELLKNLTDKTDARGLHALAAAYEQMRISTWRPRRFRKSSI